ncbi:LPXTG-motif cell wall-anchored protein [Microbacteriaceae bacterium SG_E_30_P1]|uniref:LPXTG-motif cell wall-anchored protein n=1 Tax=Antiquaquibacter oligotrophicus TaxID=2880260 RepID=A0ABT6KJ58_9MICO|nr:fibronectin type III domain-containing protein [Antiquaquibacter oligotrophicus]MDH6179999.1 LPXTG-motif cell wall-anchored protein [Antiquaquibacter oligotrophicus]UDF14245.1 fibronectin type III domain-containing protein [Antiquaquibacter oligotrophicus]
MTLLRTLSAVAVTTVVASTLFGTAAMAAPLAVTSVSASDATPERVVLTPPQDPSTSQSFTWRTGGDVTDGTVWIREVGATTWRTAAAYANEPLMTGSFATRTHSATVDQLTPGTEYEYQVGTDAAKSATYRFTTAGTPGDPFTFIYFGDAQNDIAAKWSPVVDQAYERYPDAVGTVNAGDLINNSDRDSEWTEWFGAMDGYSQTTNVIAAPGNHEYSGDEFLKVWKSNFEYDANGPQWDGNEGTTDAQKQEAAYRQQMQIALDETAYYTDYQGVRFISLNASRSQAIALMTPDVLPPCLIGCPNPTELWLQVQAEWLDSILANNPNQWAVAVFHQPVFSTATGRDEADVRAAWLPVFQRNDIDLVLMGHDHTYARGYVNEDATATPGVTTGPVYAVSVSGPKYYDQQPEDNNVWTQNGATQVTRAGYTSTFQGITVSGNTLRYESIVAAKWGTGDEESTTDVPIGGTLDAFTITKYSDGSKYVTEDGVAIPGPGAGPGPVDPGTPTTPEEPAGTPAKVDLGFQKIGELASALSGPSALDETKGILWVSDKASGSVGRVNGVDIGTGDIVGTFDVGGPVIDLSFDASLSGIVAAYSTGSGTAANGYSTAAGSLGEPLLDDPIVLPYSITGIGIDSGSGIVYFSLSVGVILAIDAEEGEIVGQYPVGAGVGRMRVDPATGNLYVLFTGQSSSELRILAGRSGMTQLGTYTLDAGAAGVSVDPKAGLAIVGHTAGGFTAVDVLAGTATRFADAAFGSGVTSVSTHAGQGVVYVTTPTGVIVVGREQAPRITSSPSRAAIESTATTELSASAWAVPAADVQWQLRAPGTSEWIDLDGENTTDLTVSGLATGVQYRADFTNEIGGERYSTVSATATVWSTAPDAAPQPITPTSANKGSGITATVTGGVITVNVDRSWNGLWVGAYVHSDPVFAGWHVVTDGTFALPVPAGLTGNHRVALHDANGDILGWVQVSIPTAGGSAAPGPQALASTGSSMEGILALAALLLLGGATVVIARRRRANA